MNIKIFKDYYLETKDKISYKMDLYNEKLIANKNHIVGENLALFKDLNSGGKYIRGVLAHLGYYLLNDDPDYALGLSIAYEVFQTAILVHDDIIDNDNIRRGKDTVHFANLKKYRNLSENQVEVKHLADSIGICVGDYGLFEAIKIISKEYALDQNIGKVIYNFSEVVVRTVEGEIIDTVLPFNGKHNIMNDNIEEDIMTVYRLKTAYYTIIGPLSIGIILAGGESDKLADIEKFGEKVGIAFQIQDDILGIFSDETGKIKGSDIKEFKQTILYSHILSTNYKDEFLKVYGVEEITEETIKKVQELLVKSKSLEYAENMMNNMYNESLTVLDSITWLNEDKKNLLRGFVEYLRIRNK